MNNQYLLSYISEKRFKLVGDATWGVKGNG